MTTSVMVRNGFTVTRIGNEAFARCSHLTSVSIPGSVPSIGKNAFSVLFDWRYSPNPFLTLCCSRGSDAEQFRMMNPDPGIICAGEDDCMHYRIMTCEMRSLPNDAIALIPIRGRIWRGLRRWLWRRRFILIPLRGRIRCAFSISRDSSIFS